MIYLQLIKYYILYNIYKIQEDYNNSLEYKLLIISLMGNR